MKPTITASDVTCKWCGELIELMNNGHWAHLRASRPHEVFCGGSGSLRAEPIKTPPGPAVPAASSSQAAGPVFNPCTALDRARLNRASELLREVAKRSDYTVQLQLSLALGYILKANKELEATEPR